MGGPTTAPRDAPAIDMTDSQRALELRKYVFGPRPHFFDRRYSTMQQLTLYNLQILCTLLSSLAF